MRSSVSHDALNQLTSGVSRVKNLKNFITNSPLRRRRALSQSIDSGLSTSGRGVFGVPLVALVTTEGVDVPKIIRRIVQHVETHGLKEEGVYRINGSAKQIEKLKASFNTVGDADFTDVEVAAIAGLLKLFLREMPTPLIPSDIEAKMIGIQQRYPGEMTEEAAVQLRDCLTQLPHVELAVFKYIINHLSRVAQHSAENKMNAIALSIVFGPGIFHCGGGLEGMKLQGYANSVLCRYIAHSSTLLRFGEKKAEQGGSPVINQSSESPDVSLSPTALHAGYSPDSPLSPSSPPLPPSSSSPDGSSFLRRQIPVKKGKKRTAVRSWSVDTMEHPATNTISITSSSAGTSDSHQPSPPSIPTIMRDGGVEEENGGRSLSPFSSSAHMTSFTISPPTSPSPNSSPSLTPRSSKALNTVIEGSVKKFLFGPPLPSETNNPPPPSKDNKTDVYGLLLPSSKGESTKNDKPHPQQSRDNHMITNDVTEMTSEPKKVQVKLRGGEKGGGEGGRERREGGRKNRRSVVVGEDEGSSEIQVLTRSRDESSDVVVVESGKVSNLVRQFNDVDTPTTTTSTSHSQSQSQGDVPLGNARRKMDSKLLDKFEKTGLIMRMAKAPSPSSLSQPTSEPPHIILHDSSASPSLQHLTKTRPKGPANRRPPSQKPASLSPPPSPSSSTTTTTTIQPPPAILQDREREGERGRGGGEEKKKAEKEELDTLGVPGIRRHRRSPKQERKRKPTPYSTQIEIGPEDSTTTPVIEGWKDELEDGIVKEVDISRPSNPVPLPETAYSPPQQFSPPTSSPSSSNSTSKPHSKRKPHRKERNDKTSSTESNTESIKEHTPAEVITLTVSEETDGPVVPEERERDDREKAKRSKKEKEKEEKKEVKKSREKKEEEEGVGKDAERGKEAALKLGRKNKEEEDEKKKKGGWREREVTSKEEEKEEKREEKGETRREQCTPGLEDTLRRLMSSLKKKRASSGRPDSLEEMTSVQLSEEKNAVQRTLLHFEKVHGRPATLVDKELMRPLYDRYREVKKLLAFHRSTHSTTHHQHHHHTVSTQLATENTVSVTDSTLPSITLLTSGLAHSLPLESGHHLSSVREVAPHSTSLSSPPPSSSLATSSNSPSNGRVTFRKRAVPLDMREKKEKVIEKEEEAEDELRREGENKIKKLKDLYREQEEALAEKKKLRKILKEFESDFFTKHTRVPTKDDRLPRQQEYQEYKAIKERLLKISNEININTPLQKTV